LAEDELEFVLGGLVAHLLARDAAAVSQKHNNTLLCHGASLGRMLDIPVGRPYLPDEEDHLIVVFLAAR
jgi:hypothetical protein